MTNNRAPRTPKALLVPAHLALNSALWHIALCRYIFTVQSYTLAQGRHSV